jgi:uncharacterized iron-regulated membrane protein
VRGKGLNRFLGAPIARMPSILRRRSKYRWSRFNRQVHYWLSLGVALPLGLVIASGLLLQLKKQIPWVQPTEQRGSGAPAGTMAALLDTLRARPDVGVASWDDVDRVDVRPGKGLVKVTTTDRLEVQLDAATGRVLQVAVRRSDLIESLHDGSFFGDVAKLGVFLPAGALLLVLWFTGLILFVQPFWRRRKPRRTVPHPLHRPPVGEGRREKGGE